jgi:sugar lactone lactonase YvrE
MSSSISTLTHPLRAQLAIQAHDKIGEGPAWDALAQRLIWSDHVSGRVHEAKMIEGTWRETKRWDLGRHVAAVIPGSDGNLVAVLANEILMLDEGGKHSLLARLEIDPHYERFNDAKCDARGRLWAGTLTTDFRPGAASLYRIDPDGAATKMLTGLTLANGLDWSPDGSILYVIDSLTRCVDALDFEAVPGTIHNRRTVMRLEHGVPNGMTVDTDGCLWIAATGAGEVQRYSAAGELLARISISTPGATSCAFGGEQCRDLFITSRAGRLPEVVSTLGLTPQMMENEGPEAGALFVCRPGVQGIPAHRFALDSTIIASDP